MHLPGLIPDVQEVVLKEMADGTAVPSPLAVEHLWIKTIDDADRIDDLLARIYGRLIAMKKWNCKGLVSQDELDQAAGWVKAKARILNYLLRGRSENTFWEDEFIDGNGI
jgi:hypothetical protein